MISWIALAFSVIGCGLAFYTYMYGTRLEPLNAEDLFDGLLGENDAEDYNEYNFDDEPREED